MNETVTKRFLLYFRLMLLVWILIANAIIHLTGMEYSWLIFLSNIMMFTLEGDVKDRFVTVELGGLVGLILTVIALLSITALTPVLGGFFGFLLKLLFRKRSTDNRLIVSLATLFAFCGVCALLDVSPLLGCMSMGMVYINLTNDSNLFQQLAYFSPPVLLLFFVRSGLNFRLDALFGTQNTLGSVPLILVGVLYFITRIAGKYAGAWLGCLLVRKPNRTRDYLGRERILQACVAIGLAALGARTLGGEIGQDLQTIILASSVLYELIGPGCAKLALYLSRSYSTKLEELVEVDEAPDETPKKTELELLIERIQKIQQELPAHNYDISPEEQAFTQAAIDQREQLGDGRLAGRSGMGRKGG